MPMRGGEVFELEVGGRRVRVDAKDNTVSVWRADGGWGDGSPLQVAAGSGEGGFLEDPSGPLADDPKSNFIVYGEF